MLCVIENTERATLFTINIQYGVRYWFMLSDGLFKGIPNPAANKEKKFNFLSPSDAIFWLNRRESRSSF